MTETARLLLTRPQPQSEAFAAALAAALPGRFTPVIAPLLAIEPVPVPVDLDGAAALLFTSASGVEMLAARHADRSLPAFCVGEMTARAARAAGFVATSADGDVQALANLVGKAAPRDGILVHVRGRHAAGDLAGALGALGFAVRGLEIYDQVRRPLADPVRRLLANREIAAVAAFSPRTAAFFAEEARAAGWDLGGTDLVALSAAAALAHTGPEPRRRIIAPTPTRDGMIAALATI